jgi:pyruvoyl-dependent arginine decarboxylase (PvlArgDC)
MPRRYGRTQKNKHRARIAELEQQAVGLQSTIGRLSNRLASAKNTLNEIIQEIENICQYSSALPPKTIEMSRKVEQFRVAERMPVLPFSADQILADVMVKNHVLYKLHSDILINYRNQMQAHLHVRCVNGEDMEAGYMVSEAAFMSMSEDQLVNQIVPKMCREMIRLMRGGKR